VVTSGSVCGLMTSLMALVEPGEEVLLPDPGWPNYEMMVMSIGAIPVRYRLSEEHDFAPDLSELESQIGPRTKAIVVNSPSNPTGAVFGRAVVRALVDLANVHDLYILSDEVYDELVYEGEHYSPARWDTDGRVISVYSFSKTYAMTGWRVGYVARLDRGCDQQAAGAGGLVRQRDFSEGRRGCACRTASLRAGDAERV
jgi:aspartate aminotransferase/aminotransferase